MGKAKDTASLSSSDERKPLQEYDPSRKGPIKKRSCTDIICCLLFVIFILGLVAVGVYSYVWGNPKLLLYPTDSEGNLCGYGDYKSKSKLFFFDLVQCGKLGAGVFVQGCPTPQVCVASCPTENYVYLQDIVSGDKSNLICKDGVDTNSKTLQELVDDKDCAAYYLKSTPILDRCIPIDNLVDAAEAVIDVGGEPVVDNDNNTVTGTDLGIATDAFKAFLQAKEYAEKIINDIIETWYLIIAALVITMLLSLIWIGLMRWLAGFMVWLAVILFVGIFAGLTGVCFWQYLETRDSGETYTIHMGFNMTFSKEKFFLISGIIVGIIFLIIFLILLFLCQRIMIAIQLIKEGSRAIGNMMFTLVFPIIPFLLQLFVVAVWLSVAIYLASIGRAQSLANSNATDNETLDVLKQEARDLFEQIPCDTDANSSGAISDLCGVIKYGDGQYTIYLQIYNLFMGFWMVNFVIALGQMTLAGAFASYYWAFDKSKDIPTFPILGALWRSVRYHLGSMAFGSLLIAIVQLIRVFLEYLDAKLKGSENPAAKFFMKCLKCCFWCLEKFLRFITKNAYIMVAIFGKNFCVSAKNAFSLILRNVVRVAVVDKVTDFVLFLSRLVVIGAVGTGTYFFFDGRIPYLQEYTPNLNFYLVPIVIVIVGSYLITSVFFSVYSMAVDTLFLCFLEDLERNDGSPEKPYFMSKGLMKILGKKNKPPQQAVKGE